MPISHKYKLIFIHIPKCAGISIWHALDLTFTEDNLISVTYPILQHMLPKDLKGKYIDNETWDTYTKFTIIRNPYDRIVSDYFWMKGNAEANILVTGSFDDFLTLREDVVNNNKYEQNIYFDHFYPMHFYFEEIQYDQVIRFENIEDEYEQLRLAHHIVNKLPKVNESNRSDFVLNEKQKERIYELYKEDFIRFGYEEQYDPVKPVREKANSDPEPISSPPLQVMPANILAPIQKSELQLFWATEDRLFSEPNSQSKIVELNNFSQSFSFRINTYEQDAAYLRFDIGNQVGFMNIHSILVQGLDGALLWTWNPNEIIDKKDIVLIESEANFKNKTIQLSFTDDPQFVIQLQQSSRKELIIEISLSSLNEEQITILSKSILKPLSFYSSLDLLLFQTEKENLTKEINALNDDLVHLKDKNATLRSDIEMKDRFLKEISDNKIIFEEELKFKSNIISNNLAEKEKLEKLLLNSSSEIKAFEATILEKEKNILKNESEINQLLSKLVHQEKVLNDEKEKLRQQLNREKEKFNQQLKEEKGQFNQQLKEEKDQFNQQLKEDQNKFNQQLKEGNDKFNQQLKEKNEKFNLQVNKINQLSIERDHLSKNLSEALSQLNTFKKLISEKDKNIQTIELHVLQLSSKVDYLENAIQQEKSHVSDLSKIVEGLKNELSESKTVLKQKDVEILKYVTKELNQKNTEIEFYKRVYEDRKLLGVIKDRLLKSEKK